MTMNVSPNLILHNFSGRRVRKIINSVANSSQMDLTVVTADDNDKIIKLI
jgi:hypothetical protein